jgi:hypothetical protein
LVEKTVLTFRESCVAADIFLSPLSLDEARGGEGGGGGGGDEDKRFHCSLVVGWCIVVTVVTG